MACFHVPQVKQQKNEWAQQYSKLQAALQAGAAVSKDEFFWALISVRSRAFSGPYIGSTLTDRFRTAILVAFLGVTNVLLGISDLQKTLSAVSGAFIFNILYEIILSRSLKQYAMCPMIDLMNHSSQVRAPSATCSRAFLSVKRRRQRCQYHPSDCET